jgi:type IV fimbrial biogenesis protein FimT
MNTYRRMRQLGATLVECSIAAAITAVSVGIAVPSLAPLADRKRLEGAAAQLETDIQYARSLAVSSGVPLRISFNSEPAPSCYVVHTGTANACSCNALGETVCGAGVTPLRTVAFEPSVGVAVRSNSNSIRLDPTIGIVTPTATMKVTDRRGDTLKVVVSILGRVRSCAATPGLQGYPQC